VVENVDKLAVPFALCLKSEFVGVGYHHVAGEDCDIRIPFPVHCRAVVAEVGFVHYVVVHEGEVVQNFNGKRNFQGVVR